MAYLRRNIESRIESAVRKRRLSLEFLASTDLCAEAGNSGNRSCRGQKSGGIEGLNKNIVKIKRPGERRDEASEMVVGRV